MGILDDAIKEHLELKRQHGADVSELKQLEDEAFGAAERPGGEPAAPDPGAEAPTEFLQQPDLGQPEQPEASAAEVEEAPSKRAPRAEIADLQEGPAPAEAEEEGEPAEEKSPAMEHETVPEPQPSAEPEPASEPEQDEQEESSHSTEEREQIAEQPTEMFDVAEELGSSQAEAPSEEELVEEVEDDADDFFDEKRLSDELDEALEGPSDAAEEGDAEDGAAEVPAAEEPEEEDQAEEPESGEHDALEDTPDFLEEAPEDDQLWFEQKPPKDFDFDD